MILNLDAVDVLYMHYITGRTVAEMDQHDFWAVQYGRVPEALHHRLLASGIIYEDDSLPEMLGKLRVFELKHLLKTAGLKISGNKPELILRITQNESEIDFTDVPLKKVCRLDEKYIDFYRQTAFIDYFHFNGGFDLHEVYDFYLENDDLSSHQIAVQFLEQKAENHLEDKNKYPAIKAFYLLSHYAHEEMEDTILSMHYLHRFAMLVVLQAIGNYRSETDSTLRAEYFDMDAYTLARYRAFLVSEKISSAALYRYMVESTRDLPFDDDDRRQAAAFIVNLALEVSDAKDQLRRYIDDEK